MGGVYDWEAFLVLSRSGMATEREQELYHLLPVLTLLVTVTHKHRGF